MRPQSHGLARTSTQSTQSASGYPRAEVERNSGEAGLPRMLPTTDGGADAKQAQQAQQEASRLRQEIESTTEEANARINQASDAIRTLKERLAARQAEHERLRQETSELQRESERLEAQNVQLEGQLRHPAGALAAPDGRQEEVQRLQREARFLGEQKDEPRTLRSCDLSLRQLMEGGMIRLETLIELKCLNSRCSSLCSDWN